MWPAVQNLGKPMSLPDNWYSFNDGGCDCSQPGIYEWRIVGVGCYVGQYKSTMPKRCKRYIRNVENLMVGKKPLNGKKFRRIHHALLDAIRAGKTVRLTILENCTLPNINQRELELIKERGCTLNGRPSRQSAKERSSRNPK
jgi:hypothetical protein